MQIGLGAMNVKNAVFTTQSLSAGSRLRQLREVCG
jgi:hypothetical protein